MVKSIIDPDDNICRNSLSINGLKNATAQNNNWHFESKLDIVKLFYQLLLF